MVPTSDICIWLILSVRDIRVYTLQHVIHLSYKSIILFQTIRPYTNRNWESPWLFNWVIQILLSELLDVPTSTETGKYTEKMNFYDPESHFEYGTNGDLEALTASYEVGGDCSLLDNTGEEGYVGCAHFTPEVWETEVERVQTLIRQGILEPSEGLGVLGQEAWYMPKRLAEEDPSLLSYLGLMGEKNRRKLAETFPRPVTWKIYCDEVSASNCTMDDGAAARYPEENEYDRMYVEGLYIGHFRKTEKNDW